MVALNRVCRASAFSRQPKPADRPASAYVRPVRHPVWSGRCCALTSEPSGMNVAQFKDVAVAAAKQAGGMIMEAWDKPRQVTAKASSVDLVTETDRLCEEAIINTIRASFPDHKIIGEEQAASDGATPELTNDPTWIIDPLDGTTNFIHKFPFVAVCIGLAINQEVIVGVVYNPVLNEMYSAVKGERADVNGTVLRVSNTHDMKDALVATEIGTSRDPDTVAALSNRITNIVAVTRSVRCCGSCAMNMCGVACGRLDAFYEIGFGGPWDVAAASLIVQEAGGMVLDPSGEPFDLMSRRVLCGTPVIAVDLSAIIATARISKSEPKLGHSTSQAPQRAAT